MLEALAIAVAVVGSVFVFVATRRVMRWHLSQRRAIAEAFARVQARRAGRVLYVGQRERKENETPPLVLSPLDAKVFVDALLNPPTPALLPVLREAAERFEGKGGASGGAGASGGWDSPAEKPAEPVVEAGAERSQDAPPVEAEREAEVPDTSLTWVTGEEPRQMTAEEKLDIP